MPSVPSAILEQKYSFLLHGCEIRRDEGYWNTQLAHCTQEQFLLLHPAYILSRVEGPLGFRVHFFIVHVGKLHNTDEAQRGGMTCPKPHTLPDSLPSILSWAGVLRTDHLGAGSVSLRGDDL